jgi:flagellar P-ring protein precursor FlgI
MIKKLLSIFLIICLSSHLLLAQETTDISEEEQGLQVRLKDVSNIIEARDNQLMGFGLVVGLRNSGDSRSTAFTETALTNLLSKLGISAGGRSFSSRNVAAVMVTATLPPFIKPGQRINVTVSAVGDSNSLSGGTLLLTPLKGPDLNTYAIAQGPVLVGGETAESETFRVHKNQSTVGRIPNGAIVESEVPITFSDQHNITIVLHDSNFITASRATEAIKKNGFPSASAIDANTIKIPLTDLESTDLVNAIAKLENITFVPDASSKVVINNRTGTVVIGEKVRLFPVALTHGNISIKISEGGAGGFGAAPAGGAAASPVTMEENETKIIYLNPNDTLSSLVNALNEIGATPKDLISILQALKESGALVAHLEII